MKLKLIPLIFFFVIKICYGFSFSSDAFFSFSSISLSNFISISGDGILNGDINTNLKNHMFMLYGNQMKVSFKGFEIGALFYSEYYGYINNSTLNFIKGLINNDLSVGDYDIYGEIKGYSVGGIYMKRRVDLGDFLALNFSPKLYIGLDYQNGVLKGNFSRIDEVSYSFDLLLDYIYNKNLLYTRMDNAKGKGIGYSFDFEIVFSPFENFSFYINIQDLWGKIFWFHIPYTEAKTSTDREYVDENGYIVFRPLISGYEGCKDFIQLLPLELNIGIAHKGEKDEFVMELSFKEEYKSLFIRYYYSLFSSNIEKLTQINFGRFKIMDNLSPSGFYFLFYIDNYQFFNMVYGLSFLM